MSGIAGKLRLCPVDFSEACEFVRLHHRHHIAPQGHKFSIGCADDKDIHGVVIVGRPVARLLDTGLTLEVTRLCSNGTPNVCSMLYGAARRAAWALGYQKLITYTLASEDGGSLLASGYTLVGERGGGTWLRAVRPRVDKHPLQRKLLWEVTA